MEIALLRDDLQNRSERLRLALAAGRMGMAELDVASGLVTVDQLLSDHLGLDGPGEVTIEELTRNFDPQGLQDTQTVIQNAIEKGVDYAFDFRVLEDGHEERWIRTLGLSYRTSSGAQKVVGPTIDISQERRDKERLRMMVEEMSHRVKNLFAVVGSIISSAPKQNEECEVFAESMLSRINALSFAYDLARKQGDLNGVNWIDLLNRILGPHRTHQDVILDGPDTFISSETLTTLTLMLHELSTNALKYGAFSVPDGILAVTWTLKDDDVLELSWKETVPGFDKKKAKDPGFGSKLVTMAVQQMRGRFNRTFTKDGIDVELRFQLN